MKQPNRKGGRKSPNEDMAIRDTGRRGHTVPDAMPREWVSHIPITHRRLMLDVRDKPTHRLEARQRLQGYIAEVLHRLGCEVNDAVIWEVEKILRVRYQTAGAHMGHLHEWLQYTITEVRVAHEDVVNRTSFSTNPPLFRIILDLRLQVERHRPKAPYPPTTEVLVSDKMGAPDEPTTLAERNIRVPKEPGPSKLTPVVRAVAGVEYDATINPKEKTMAINDIGTGPAATASVAGNSGPQTAQETSNPQPSQTDAAQKAAEQATAADIGKAAASVGTNNEQAKTGSRLKTAAKWIGGGVIVVGAGYGVYRLAKGGKAPAPEVVVSAATAVAEKAEVVGAAATAAFSAVAGFGRRFF